MDRREAPEGRRGKAGRIGGMAGEAIGIGACRRRSARLGLAAKSHSLSMSEPELVCWDFSLPTRLSRGGSSSEVRGSVAAPCA